MIVTREQIDALDAVVRWATSACARMAEGQPPLNPPKLPIHIAHNALRRLRYYASVEKD